MLDEIIKEIDNLDLLSGLENFLNLYEETMPEKTNKYIYRKFRKGKKIYIKRIYLYKVNYIHELLPSPFMVNSMLKHIRKSI